MTTALWLTIYLGNA